jgi:hypothetical protein
MAYNPISKNLRFGDIIIEASIFAHRLINDVDKSSLLPNNFAILTCTRKIFSALSPRIVSDFWLDQFMLKLLLDNCETLPFALKIYYVRKVLGNAEKTTNNQQQLISSDEAFLTKLLDRIDYIKYICLHNTYITDNFIKTKIHDNPKIFPGILETVLFARALIGDANDDHPIGNKFITAESYRIFLDVNSKSSAKLRSEMLSDIEQNHVSNQEFQRECAECGMFETICARLERPGEPESLFEGYLTVLYCLCCDNAYITKASTRLLFNIGRKFMEFDSTSKYHDEIRGAARWVIHYAIECHPEVFDALPAEEQLQFLKSIIKFCVTGTRRAYVGAAQLAMDFSEPYPSLLLNAGILDAVKQLAPLREEPPLFGIHMKLTNLFGEKFEEFANIKEDYELKRERVSQAVGRVSQDAAATLRDLHLLSQMKTETEKNIKEEREPLEQEKRNDMLGILWTLAKTHFEAVLDDGPELLDLTVRAAFETSNQETQLRAVGTLAAMLRAAGRRHVAVDVAARVVGTLLDARVIIALLVHIGAVYDNLEGRTISPTRDARVAGTILAALQLCVDSIVVSSVVAKRTAQQIVFGSVDGIKILKKVKEIAEKLPGKSKLWSWKGLTDWCGPESCLADIVAAAESEM